MGRPLIPPLDKIKAGIVLSPLDYNGEPCWIWTKSLNNMGYAIFRAHGRTRLGHRVAYMELKGPIPEGLELDHLCRNRACINPAHLEPVTRSTNNRRGLSPVRTSLMHTAKTHCPQGHEYTPENTAVYKGRRNCRACKNIARNARRRGQEPPWKSVPEPPV